MKIVSLAAFLCCCVAALALAHLSFADAARLYNVSDAMRAWYLSKVDACSNEASAAAWTCAPCKALARGIVHGPGAAPIVAPDRLEHVRSFSASAEFPSIGHATVGYSPSRNQIDIIFRGTRGLGWLYDLDFKQVPFPGCPAGSSGAAKAAAHEGFVADYALLKANGTIAHAFALAAQYPSAIIATSGHSLGSALAVVAAADIALNAPAAISARLKKITVFGSPRVFNHAAAKCVGEVWRKIGVTSVHIVNGADLVPKLPLLSMAYVHSWAEEAYFPNGIANGSNSSAAIGQLEVCENTPGQENLACSATVSIFDGQPADHTWFCAVPPCISSGC